MGRHRRVTVAWQPAEGSFKATGTSPLHSLTINAPAPADEKGRPPTGFSATELLLAGAASCSAWDVVEMLRKRRVAMRALDVAVEGHQASDPPWQYERIVLHYRVAADGISGDVLERVIRLSIVRYCSVIATLRGVAQVEATLELIGADGASGGEQPVRLDVAVAEPLDSAPAEPLGAEQAEPAPPTADEE